MTCIAGPVCSCSHVRALMPRRTSAQYLPALASELLLAVQERRTFVLFQTTDFAVHIRFADLYACFLVSSRSARLSIWCYMQTTGCIGRLAQCKGVRSNRSRGRYFAAMTQTVAVVITPALTLAMTVMLSIIAQAAIHRGLTHTHTAPVMARHMISTHMPPAVTVHGPILIPAQIETIMTTHVIASTATQTKTVIAPRTRVVMPTALHQVL